MGVGLTQIGEFSFMLIQVARNASHVGDDVYNTTLAASLITILLNAALMRVVPRWIGRAQLARAAESATSWKSFRVNSARVRKSKSNPG